MRHVHSLSEAKLSGRSLVTIGAFDGVHRGHQYLVNQLIESAFRQDAVPIVLTFYPHPSMVTRGFQTGFYLSDPGHKAHLLGELGVEVVITHPFNEVIRHIRARDFISELVDNLNPTALWVGEDFAMGYQREGNVAFLRQVGSAYGFKVQVVDFVTDNEGNRYSSSRIREAVKEGNVILAADLLGRYYSVSGKVVKGAQRGRTIGIPTANIDVPGEMAVPGQGVYAAYACIDKRVLLSVVNIGLRPTFNRTELQPTVEVHILDFEGDLYGQMVSVAFVTKLRDEMKFDDVKDLVNQIHADIAQAREISIVNPAPEHC